MCVWHKYTYHTRAKLMSRCRIKRHVTASRAWSELLETVQDGASRAHHKLLDKIQERSIPAHLNRMLWAPPPTLPTPSNRPRHQKKRECPAPAKENEDGVFQTVAKPCASHTKLTLHDLFVAPRENGLFCHTKYRKSGPPARQTNARTGKWDLKRRPDSSFAGTTGWLWCKRVHDDIFGSIWFVSNGDGWWLSISWGCRTEVLFIRTMGFSAQ